jgi:hypothetical protein
MQRHGEHSYTIVEAVFCAWSLRRLYNENNTSSSVEFSVEDGHGKFVV